MKQNLVMPHDTIELLDGELEMVLGGFVPMPDGINGGEGCGCANGVGCGCGCAYGIGCGCGCGVTTTSAPAE